jgi:hypothetical protein
MGWLARSMKGRSQVMVLMPLGMTSPGVIIHRGPIFAGIRSTSANG